MRSRSIAIAVVAFLPACAGDATAVVASLRRADVESVAGAGGTLGDDLLEHGGGLAGMLSVSSGPFVGADGEAILGPGSVYWSLYWSNSGGASSGGATAEWQERPTAESVSVRAVSPRDLRAGLQFQFPNAEERDLSQFNKVGLTVDVYDGDMFELFLGQDRDHGCSYKFLKKDDGVYSGNLAYPTWCVPTQCDFDLHARGGLFLADVPNVSRLSARVRDLRFYSEPVGAAARRASAMGAAPGPGDYCWFLAAWNGGVAAWGDVTPTSSGAHVRSSAQGNQVAGMAFEVKPEAKLSQYRALVIDAAASDGTIGNNIVFLVQAVNKDRGLTWELKGDGKRQPYRLELNSPTYFFPPGGSVPNLTLDEVSRFEIVGRTNGGEAKLDAHVYGVGFVK